MSCPSLSDHGGWKSGVEYRRAEIKPSGAFKSTELGMGWTARVSTMTQRRQSGRLRRNGLPTAYQGLRSNPAFQSHSPPTFGSLVQVRPARSSALAKPPAGL